MKISNKIIPKLLDGESVGDLSYLDTAFESGNKWMLLYKNTTNNRNYRALFQMFKDRVNILNVERCDCEML